MGEQILDAVAEEAQPCVSEYTTPKRVRHMTREERVRIREDLARIRLDKRCKLYLQCVAQNGYNRSEKKSVLIAMIGASLHPHRPMIKHNSKESESET